MSDRVPERRSTEGERTVEAILAQRQLAARALETAPEGEIRTAIEARIEALDNEYRLALELRQAQVRD